MLKTIEWVDSMVRESYFNKIKKEGDSLTEERISEVDGCGGYSQSRQEVQMGWTMVVKIEKRGQV